MLDIEIYSEPVGPISGSTPFGFYDTDSVYQLEAPKFTRWAARRLGYPMTNVELQSGSFFTAFEEAVTVYGNEIYQWKIRENYLTMEGNLVPTSSNFSFNNSIITPNLGRIIKIAKNYGSEAGTGGTVRYYTGSISLSAGKQDYDLNVWASLSASLEPNDSIEVKRIFYENPPAIVRYFDPYAGTGTGIQSLLETFGFGQFSPGINFMLMPIYFDLEKIQAIEFNDQIRRSAYSFDLVNNQLRIFPIPTIEGAHLYFHYIKVSERDGVISNQLSGGGYSASFSSNKPITNISNVPFQNPVYSQINSIGKQWIYQYGLAVAKEMLGLIRNKYSTVPIPGSEVTLNGQTLIDGAAKEKDALLLALRDTLAQTSRKVQMENQKMEADFTKDTLNNVPMSIYIM